VWKYARVMFEKKRWCLELIASSLILMCLYFLSPIINSNLIDKGLINRDMKLLLILIACNFTMTLVIEALVHRTQILNDRLSEFLKFRYCSIGIQHLLKLNYYDIKSKPYNEYISAIEGDSSSIATFVADTLIPAIVSILNILSSLLGLLFLSLNMTPFVFIVIPLRFYIMAKLSNRQKRIAQKSMHQNIVYGNWFADKFSKLKTIKLFNMMDITLSSYGEIYQKKRTWL